MAAEQFHALVLGASGISGWSLLNQLCQYPRPQTWNRISGTTNPFDLAHSGLPEDTRLQVASAIDLTKYVYSIIQVLKDKVQSVEIVTHVFFTAYIAKDNRAELKEINTKILENSIRAQNQIAHGLRAVILPTGGKGYGLEYKEFTLHPPLRADMPRILAPFGDEAFYYSQYDTLARLSQSSKWTFAEIRPDGIEYGARNRSLPLRLPDILSKLEIYVALKDELRKNGPAFNVADEDDPITSATVWPGICRQFGLVGVGPRDGDQHQQQSMEEFVKTNRSSWNAVCEEFSLHKDSIDVQGWAHTHFMLVDFDFDRWYDLSRARPVGLTESIDTVEAYRIAFERMAAAGIIPSEYLE